MLEVGARGRQIGVPNSLTKFTISARKHWGRPKAAKAGCRRRSGHKAAVQGLTFWGYIRGSAQRHDERRPEVRKINSTA